MWSWFLLASRVDWKSIFYLILTWFPLSRAFFFFFWFIFCRSALATVWLYCLCWDLLGDPMCRGTSISCGKWVRGRVGVSDCTVCCLCPHSAVDITVAEHCYEMFQKSCAGQGRSDTVEWLHFTSTSWLFKTDTDMTQTAVQYSTIAKCKAWRGILSLQSIYLNSQPTDE